MKNKALLTSVVAFGGALAYAYMSKKKTHLDSLELDVSIYSKDGSYHRRRFLIDDSGSVILFCGKPANNQLVLTYTKSADGVRLVSKYGEHDETISMLNLDRPRSVDVGDSCIAVFRLCHAKSDDAGVDIKSTLAENACEAASFLAEHGRAGVKSVLEHPKVNEAVREVKAYLKKSGARRRPF